MAVNFDPVFTANAKVAVAQVLTANTARDGTGTVVDLVTGATDGTRIDRIVIKAEGTTTAGMIRFFVQKSAGSTRLFAEVVVAPITPAAGVATWGDTSMNSNAFAPALCLLQSGDKLRASTHNAETFDITVFYGDYS